jgi:hypothetical protein
MLTRCPDCRKHYDDAKQLNYCPHKELYSPEILKQKDQGIRLIGKRVHFRHQPPSESYRVVAMRWDGMLTLQGLSGEFAPHLFEVVEKE